MRSVIQEAAKRDSESKQAKVKLLESEGVVASTQEALRGLIKLIDVQRSSQRRLVVSKVSLDSDESGLQVNLRDINFETAEFNSSKVDCLADVDRIRSTSATAEQHQRDCLTKLHVCHESVLGFMKDMDNLHARLEEDKRQLNDILIARNRMDELLASSATAEKRNFDDAKFYQAVMSKCIEDNFQTLAELESATAIVRTLERSRDKFGMERSEKAIGLNNFADLLQSNRAELTDLNTLKLGISDELNKLKRTFANFRSDRNATTKELNHIETAISTMQTDFLRVSSDLLTVSSDVVEKESDICRQLHDITRISEALADGKEKLGALRKKRDFMRNCLDDQSATIANLTSLVDESHAQIVSNKLLFDASVSARDLLGSLMIRRNDELVLTHEKSCAMLVALQRASDMFDLRYRHFAELSLALTKVESHIGASSFNRGRADELKRQVFLMQQALIKEQAILKDLSSKADNPENASRWRDINIDNLDRKQVLTKIRSLQRRLIQKTEISVEISLDVADRHKQIEE